MKLFTWSRMASRIQPRTILATLFFSTSPAFSSSVYRKTKTSLQKQLDKTILSLPPDFTHTDVESALRSQNDPDVALDIFRWTSHSRNYRHNASTYLTMIDIAVASRRHRLARTLVDEVYAGACDPTAALYNSLISFCSRERGLFNRAFDLYNKMLRSDDCRPTMETFSVLLRSILSRCDGGNLKVSYVYLHGVKSLERQIKKLGLIPDTFSMNMIIKAYSKCGQIDQALRVYWDMGLYACQADRYTYSYLVKGMCKEGRTGQGIQFYREMRKKGVVPTVGAAAIMACSLAMDKRFDDCVEVMVDMLDNGMRPDIITYKTLLSEMCREGRDSEALTLLQDFKRRDLSMNNRSYTTLLSSINL